MDTSLDLPTRGSLGARGSSIELLQRAQSGDDEALEALLARYAGRVRGLVRRRLGAGLRGMVESDDLVQEALIQAFLGFRRFEWRRDGALLAWFAGIVERRVLDAARRATCQKRERAREVPIEVLVVEGSPRSELAADAPSPAAVLVPEEEALRVHAAIAELDPRLAEVIRLRCTDRYSWEAVAVAMGAPSPDAARMLYARALARLRKRLGPD